MPEPDDEIRDQLVALRAEHARQADRIAALEARLAPTSAPVAPGDEGLASPVPDRRQLLRRVGAVAVGGLAAGTALALGEAGPAAAQTTDSGNPGLLGTANPASGTGVQGTSGSGRGVWGRAAAAGGTGVVGESVLGIGVQATGAVAAMRLGGTAADPMAAAVTHTEGEVLYADDSNSLWVCVADGTPGTWRKLAGKTTAGSLHVLPAPVRVYDSRPQFAPSAIGPKSPLTGGGTRAVDLKANGSGVPAGATAALVNLVAAGTARAGFMAVFRNGVPWPGTSNLNWNGTGEQASVTTITALDASALCAVYANVGTDVVVDVLGYHL